MTLNSIPLLLMSASKSSTWPAPSTSSFETSSQSSASLTMEKMNSSRKVFSSALTSTEMNLVKSTHLIPASVAIWSRVFMSCGWDFLMKILLIPPQRVLFKKSAVRGEVGESAYRLEHKPEMQDTTSRLVNSWLVLSMSTRWYIPSLMSTL